MSLSTTDALDFNGFVQAYTFNDRALASSDLFKIHVCGYEGLEINIQDALYDQQFTLKFTNGAGTASQAINLGIFRNNLNNTNCPFESFSLVIPRMENKAVIDDFKLKRDMNGDRIEVNTDLAPYKYRVNRVVKGTMQIYTYNLTI